MVYYYCNLICFVFCIVILPCASNPCLHEGQCYDRSATEFECDCSLSHYRGTVCGQGILSTPAIPILIAYQPSKFLNITAYPETDLTVNIFSSSSDLQAIPSNHSFSKFHLQSYFKLIAYKEGVYTISYNVSGTDAQDFETPLSVRVVVVNSSSAAIEYDNDSLLDIPVLSPGCCNPDPGFSYQCPNSLHTVTFTSTGQWSSDSNGNQMTDEVVFALSQGLILPVSIAGIYLSSTIYDNCNTLPQTEYSYSDCQFISINSTTDCSSYDFMSADFPTLLAKQILGTSYFNYTNQLLPSWLSLGTQPQRLNEGSAFTFQDYSTFIIMGEEVSNIAHCQDLKLDQNKLFSVFAFKEAIVAQVVDEIYHYTPMAKETVCIAVDLCSGESSPLQLTLPPSSQHLIKSFSPIQVNYYMQ